MTISSATQGATIRYTIDGSTPTAEYGTEYDGVPIALESTATLKAAASRLGLAMSPVSSAEYVLAGTAATPTFEPGGGTFTATQYVTISTSTEGATIRYTTDGSAPAADYGALYAGVPITVAVSRTLRAVAYLPELGVSMVASADYAIELAVATPYFSPAGGTYPSPQTVAIATVTEGAAIRYTTDGSMPTTSYGTLYAEPIDVTRNSTVRAIAYMTGLRDSAIATGTYAIAGTVATPVFSPAQGSHAAAQTVTISTTTDGATIVYTTDGTTPSRSNGAEYSGPVPIATTTSMRAFAYKTGWTDSAVATATYSIAVDSGGNVGQWTSVATSASTVHVLYYDATNLDLKLASSSNGGETWAIQKVDYPGSVGQYGSLAVSGSSLYVAYWDSANQDLRFARSDDDGGTWTRTLVQATGNTGQYPCVGVAGSDVSISYYDITNQDLRLATSADDGATWTTQLVDATGNSGQWTSLVVDEANFYIIYQDVTNQDLRFIAYVSGSGWSSPVSWDAGPAGSYGSLRFDPSTTTLYAAYYDISNSDLKLAVSTSSDDGSTWPAPAVSTIDSAGFVGQWASLALSNGDDLVVSYFEDYAYSLQVALSLDGGATWSSSIVETNGVGQYGSVSDTGSQIYVSYYDFVNLDLKVARSSDRGASWTRY